MTPLPTLDDQRAAHLDVGDGPTPEQPGLTMTDQIRVAWRELASGRLAEPKPQPGKRRHRRRDGQTER